MSVSSIFSNSAASTSPAPGIGPTLNAKDPVNDPVTGGSSASVSFSDAARRLSGRHHGGHHHAAASSTDSSTSGTASASSVVSSAITAYQQAGGQSSPLTGATSALRSQVSGIISQVLTTDLGSTQAGATAGVSAYA